MLPDGMGAPHLCRHRAAVALSVCVVLLGTLLLAGCQFLASPLVTTPAGGLSSPTPAAPLASPTRPNPTATVFDASAPLTLTLWLPPEMALTDYESSQVVDELNRYFIAANPQVQLSITPKAPSGVGGMVNRLSTTKPVAPSQLPDLAVVDLAELPRLASEGLAAPLDDLFPETFWDGLFPFALESVSVGERKMAMPLHADILYLAYNNTMVSTPPLTWDTLRVSKSTLILPANQGDGAAADVFFAQYMARGGSLKGPNGSYLDVNIAADVLRDYRATSEAGVLLASARDLATLEECWSIYLKGEAGMAIVNSYHYMRDRGKLQRTRYAPMPTADGHPSTVAHAWGWIIVTQDPVRQGIAADYIAAAARQEWIVSWSRASHHLPAHSTALAAIIDDRDYRIFLEEQLQYALAYPSVSQYTPMQEIITEAIGDVLDGAATPDHAAASAAAMIARLR